MRPQKTCPLRSAFAEATVTFARRVIRATTACIVGGSLPVLTGLLHAVPAAQLEAQVTTLGALPGSESWYLRLRDGTGELFVFEVGVAAGAPVVVLHGGPGADFSYLLPVARGLEGEFRFVFYDQRGSLRSSARSDSITMAKHVADLEQLREALRSDRIRIVAHSAGTLLAYEYLRTFPARVAQLVLVGALPHKNGRAYFDEEYARLWSGLADSAAAFAERPAIGDAIRQAGLADRALSPKESSHVALIRQVGAESFAVERWREALPIRVRLEAARRTRETTNFDYDAGPLLASHDFAVTVVNGEFDLTVGPRGSPLWRRLQETTAPHLGLVVIPRAGHIVWRDAPDVFRVELARALARR